MHAGITAAPLRDRRAVFFGSFPNPALAPALMAQVRLVDLVDLVICYREKLMCIPAAEGSHQALQMGHFNGSFGGSTPE